MSRHPLPARWPRLALALALAVTAVGLACSGRGPSEQAVVLVVIDTIRADRVGSYGYSGGTTPRLDAFAAQGVVFRRAIAASPWTGPSVASLTTGLYPDELGVRDLEQPLPADATTLAEIMRAHGRRTGAVVSNGYVSPLFGHGQGYDTFWKEEYTGDDDTQWTPVATADRITDVALAWIAQQSEPYYLYVHYTDPHDPYWPPAEWRARFDDDPDTLDEFMMRREGALSRPLSPRDLRRMEAMYDASIAFADHEIGRFLDGVPEDALVIVVGDHGEEFRDHGGLFHGHTVFEELVRVPLIVRGPGIAPGISDELVSHVDVTPTILDCLGIGSPDGVSGTTFRRALLGKPVRREGPVFSIRENGGSRLVAARLGDWKLIYSGPRNYGLFDLAADPGERSNLALTRADIAAPLQASVLEHFEGVREPTSPESEEVLEERLDRLRSLGYVE